MTNRNAYILKILCEDAPGIVASITQVIFLNGGDIPDCQQFNDPNTGQFVMRLRFFCDKIDLVESQLKPVIERFSAEAEIIPEDRRGRVLIMVSKKDHCLNDLLYRWQKGDLNMDLVGVVSNHEIFRDQVERFNIPYTYLPVSKENKKEQEAKLLSMVDTLQVDLVVLARYMQILSDTTSQRLFGRVINIHHSFLPSFKGYRAYYQAHDKGVKLIGATAHYVSPDLDEGPIIEQEVARVKHSDRAEDLIRIGRDTECRVLSRAVKWHLEHRVFLNHNKTVVFT